MLACRNRRHRGHGETEGFAIRTSPSEGLLAVRQLGFESHGLAVAADSEGHHASRRNFTDHAAQLFHTLHLVSIETENDVVLFESGFARGRVLIDQRHFHAVFFLELQVAQAVSE